LSKNNFNAAIGVSFVSKFDDCRPMWLCVYQLCQIGQLGALKDVSRRQLYHTEDITPAIQGHRFHSGLCWFIAADVDTVRTNLCASSVLTKDDGLDRRSSARVIISSSVGRNYSYLALRAKPISELRSVTSYGITQCYLPPVTSERTPP